MDFMSMKKKCSTGYIMFRYADSFSIIWGDSRYYNSLEIQNWVSKRYKTVCRPIW